MLTNWFEFQCNLKSDVKHFGHPAGVRVDPLHQHGPVTQVAGGQPLREPEHDQLGVGVTEGGVRLARETHPGPGLKLQVAAGDGQVVIVAGQPQPVHRPVHGTGVDQAVVAGVVYDLLPRVIPGHREAVVAAVKSQRVLCVTVLLGEADIRRGPGHGEVAVSAGLGSELAPGLGCRGAAEDLKPEALVIVTHPPEPGAHPYPHVTGRDEVMEAVGLDHPGLLLLVVQVEAGPVAAAVLPLPPVQADLDSEADVATQCRHYLEHSYHLTEVYA